MAKVARWVWTRVSWSGLAGAKGRKGGGGPGGRVPAESVSDAPSSYVQAHKGVPQRTIQTRLHVADACIGSKKRSNIQEGVNSTVRSFLSRCAASGTRTRP